MGQSYGNIMGIYSGNMGIYSGNIIGYIPIYCLYISPLYPTISIYIYNIYIYILAVDLPVSSPWLENPMKIQACLDDFPGHFPPSHA